MRTNHVNWATPVMNFRDADMHCAFNLMFQDSTFLFKSIELTDKN